jgi:TRAP-type uncharacterized transport system substrate-binding protein
MPVAVRSLIMLEAASEMVGQEGWPHKQVKVLMREQGSPGWTVTLFASDSPAAIQEVARGQAQVAIINPSSALNLAHQGTGPFKEPVPLRAIAVVPDFDQIGFAVLERTGIRSLADVKEKRFPLRVSLRGQRDHSVHLFVDQVLGAYGFSLSDIQAWGGQVRYDRGLPDAPNRIGAVERGEVDAIFDEAVIRYANRAVELGMRFLSLEEPVLTKLEALGFRRGVMPKARYSKLPADVVTLDFSGFAIYTHADVPDEVVSAFCAALEARRDRIPWEGEGPLPLERACRDTLEGPLGIPLHPAAERYWRGRGYLS